MNKRYKDIKVGDLVETCSLLPGVVMTKDGDELGIRMLHYDDYPNGRFSSCAIGHCGIVRLTAEQALKRLTLGENKLGEIWNSLKTMEFTDQFDMAEMYFKLVNEYED